ncbi:MAG: hypothetical protein WC703_01645 [Candidatus Neomarinimicrobiota bacterium]
MQFSPFSPGTGGRGDLYSKEVDVKEVIEEILEEEKKAREQVVSAQQRANIDLKKAKDEARHLIESTRQNALSESEEIIGRAEKSAQEEKMAKLASAKEESEQTLNRMKSQVAHAAEELYKTIIGEVTPAK